MQGCDLTLRNQQNFVHDIFACILMQKKREKKIGSHCATFFLSELKKRSLFLFSRKTVHGVGNDVVLGAIDFFYDITYFWKVARMPIYKDKIKGKSNMKECSHLEIPNHMLPCDIFLHTMSA